MPLKIILFITYVSWEKVHATPSRATQGCTGTGGRSRSQEEAKAKVFMVVSIEMQSRAEYTAWVWLVRIIPAGSEM